MGFLLWIFIVIHFFWDLLVYPKVRVREQEDQDDQTCFPDFPSPEIESEDISPPSIAKVPKSYKPNTAFSFSNEIPNIVMPNFSLLQGTEKGGKIIDEEDGKEKLRGCSIPRPRAVLSSPDNDLVIGNKNRSKTERSFSVLKNRKAVQNRHSLCKIVPSTTENSPNAKKPDEGPDESKLKGTKGSVVAGPTQRRQARSGKPNTTRT